MEVMVAETLDEENALGWILDTHLHIHPVHDPARVLKNLGYRLKEIKRGRKGMLLGGVLADMPGRSAWDMLKKADFPGAEELQIAIIDETALRYTVDGEEIFLFSGAQVITSERIEVLAILAERPIQNGLFLRETVAAIEQAHGIVVLPWSPGKWLGRRGKLVREYLRERPNCWVGDIPMRWWGRWSLLRLRGAGALPLRILYGSDPLPIRDDERIAGMLCAELWADSLVQTGEDYVERSEQLRSLLQNGLLGKNSVRREGSYRRLSNAVIAWVNVMRLKGG
jgi:hypothetical protein